MSKEFTLEEVSRHNSPDDLFVVIGAHVYDLTKFAKFHPGGRQVLLRAAGKDVTREFNQFHHKDILTKYHDKFVVGTVKGRQAQQTVGVVSKMPYAEPITYTRLRSPYLNASHFKWRDEIRLFVDANVLPTMDKWKNDDKPPKHILAEMGKRGYLAAMTGMTGDEFPTKYLDSGSKLSMPHNEYDHFHEMILFDEFARCGHAGVIAALTNGPAIALSAVLRFGSAAMKQRVCPEVLNGRKFIALAISEPHAGSDVAGMVCTAEKTGNKFVVNGNKKWITNGAYADFFVTAVKTGKRQQLTLLLVDRELPGFTVRKIAIRDSNISGTSYLDFDNCSVDASNMIGELNQGFKPIMFNFNHERMYIATLALRLSRMCIDVSVHWAINRRVFGRSLSDIQQIRMKLAKMGRSVENLQHYLEFIVYQLNEMSFAESQMKLGDQICLAKAQASKVYLECAVESTNILGGNSMYTKGIAKDVEGALMQVKGYQIPAGAEDVMDDYAGKVAFKLAKKAAKL